MEVKTVLESPQTSDAPGPEPEAATPLDDAPVTAKARRRVPEPVLWVVALVMIVASALMVFGRTPPTPVPVVIGDGLHLEGLNETRTDNGWVVEGTIRNGPANVSQAQFGLTYTNAEGRVVAITTVEVRDFKAAQARDFKIAIPGYEPGLKRTIVPIRYKQKADD